jgi:hypothetical protein
MRKNFMLAAIFSIAFYTATIHAQTQPPIAGSYYCNSTTYLVGAGGINHATGLDVTGNNPIGILPASFGDIVIDGKGNYQLTQSKHKGKYSFDKAGSTLTFTGDLSIMKVSGYKTTGFFISYGSLTYECHCRGAKAPADAIVKKPNSSFTGTIVASLSYGSVDYIDLATSGTTNTYSYFGNTKAVSAGKTLHLQNAYDELQKRTDYPLIEIRDQKGNIMVSHQGKEWQTGVYEYGELSPDGLKFVLSGKLSQQFGTRDYNYRDFKIPSCSVLDSKNGNEIKTFVLENENKWPASWLPNGGLLLPHKGGGIDITDANFSKVTTIYTLAVSFAKCSPDGKKIIFQKGTQLFTIGLDGTNEILLTNTELDLNFAKDPINDICWSPDSKSLVIMLSDDYLRNKYYALLVSTDGKKASMVKDKNGNRITFIRPCISWISNASTQARTSNSPPASSDESSADQKAKINPGIQLISQRIKPNPATIYEPSPIAGDPNLSKAWGFYTQLMAEDFDNFNDVAAALTYIICLNYSYLHQQPSIPHHQVEKIYNQFANKLLLDKNFKKSSDDIKQELTERIVLDGISTVAAVDSKNETTIKEVTLKIMKKYIGNAANSLRITNTGMEY